MGARFRQIAVSESLNGARGGQLVSQSGNCESCNSTTRLDPTRRGRRRVSETFPNWSGVARQRTRGTRVFPVRTRRTPSIRCSHERRWTSRNVESTAERNIRIWATNRTTDTLRGRTTRAHTRIRADVISQRHVRFRGRAIVENKSANWVSYHITIIGIGKRGDHFFGSLSQNIKLYIADNVQTFHITCTISIFP